MVEGDMKEIAAESGLEESLELEAHAQSICSSTQDVIEGVTAFLEKRAPAWARSI
jgi:enoyl-CoA hydratase/carnithine racemase